MSDLFAEGGRAAALIWDDDVAAQQIVDPRLTDFAKGAMEGFAAALEATPGLLRKVVGHASDGAGDLAIDSLQGLTEVLQNADDLRATRVSVALVSVEGSFKLQIVHNGSPVTCHHVLPMTLPYLTTKDADAEQKGRFGIGLKTLRRISNGLTVHGAPYHFLANGLELREAIPAEPIPGFYDPTTDTMLSLDLIDGFSPETLDDWFKGWSEDDLVFLNTVSQFRYVGLGGAPVVSYEVRRAPWARIGKASSGPPLESRRIRGRTAGWTVYRAEVDCPADARRSHKATGPTTPISLALADDARATGLFIGFRTRVPCTLPFSIDAQFDPSTAREGLLDNNWNKWLVRQSASVIAAVALALFDKRPLDAWSSVPLASEGAGDDALRWPAIVIAEAMSAARKTISEQAMIGVADATLPIDQFAYECPALEGFLTARDLKLLVPDHEPLPLDVRDSAGRWRSVLDDIQAGSMTDLDVFVRGFSSSIFEDKPTSWWVEAAVRTISSDAGEKLFEAPCFRSDNEQAIQCVPRGTTARSVLIGAVVSDFARRWDLFDRLHDEYRNSAAAEVVLGFLRREAAVAEDVDAAEELAAFAELFTGRAFPIADPDLSLLRDRFDLLTDRRAESLGPRVGACLLLDGFVYRAGKRTDTKVSPPQAYLSRTLDSDYPYWPDAASDLPGISWLASSYDLRLKTSATRAVRKRADGTISRGPRKFLMLLGGWCSPRVIERAERKLFGSAVRIKELRALGAEHVEQDFHSPDLERVLDSLSKCSKRDRKIRSASLLRALSRHWDEYAQFHSVRAYHQATKYTYDKGAVTADWLSQLKSRDWIAVADGRLLPPAEAVVRTPQTQTLYPAESFIAGVGPADVKSDLARTLKLITEVRASDLVTHLEFLRGGDVEVEGERTLQIYRALAKLCPASLGWNAKVGDIALSELRARFTKGLVRVSHSNSHGQWMRPDELFVGRDIFLDASRFVPGGASCHPLWSALQIRSPGLDDCIKALRDVGAATYGQAAEAVMIEVYRYLETHVGKADKRQRERLRSLPVGTVGGQWSTTRPIYYVADRELRKELAQAEPCLRLWDPPCDVHALPSLTLSLGISTLAPSLTVQPSQVAAEHGEATSDHFRRCVDHLANELARNDPVTRDRLSITWQELRDMRLFVYPGTFEVDVQADALPIGPVRVPMSAVVGRAPLRLFVAEAALANREQCGRAIASLFPPEVRRHLEAEWVASWLASTEAKIEMIRTASDEEHARAMAERAAATTVGPTAKIKVSSPASRKKIDAPPRRLKASHGGVVSVAVFSGTPPKAASPSGPRLKDRPPPPSPPLTEQSSGPVEYTTADLEQRGWEILTGVLASSETPELVDFRKRHGVGADGVIDWKTFVELKATGRGPQGSVEMSATEFERARERGIDFMIALVSGLEEDHSTEVRLILDPANRATIRPVGSVRLVGLADAPCVMVRIGDDPGDEVVHAGDKADGVMPS